MATEKNGLDYRIVIRDEFSASLKLFRAQLLLSKQALETFKQSRGAFSGISQELNNASNSMRSLSREQVNIARESRAAAREEQDRLRKFNSRIKEREQIQKGLGKFEVQRKKDETAEAKKAQQAVQAQARAEAAAAAAQQRTARTLAAQQKEQQARTKGLQDDFKKLTSSIFGTNDAANRVVFTFRRIIGIAFLIRAFQQVQGAFGAVIAGGINFNRAIESSSVAIGGIITAIGTVRDLQGNLLEGGEKFNASLRVAGSLVDQLKQKTLETGLPLEDLVRTFQVAIGPGLAAGLNPKEIKDLAVGVAQAATLIGQPLDQLSEEIRALLSGAISGRTTRIATALGIKPEDIRRAKRDVGGLAAFLQERFKTFNLTSAAAGKTFEGSIRRARATIDLISGTAAVPLFDTLKATLNDLIGSLVKVDLEGRVLPRPEAVAVAQQLFEGIRQSVLGIADAIRRVDPTDLFLAARVLGTAFAIAGQIIGGAVQGIVDGLAIAGRLAQRFSSAIGGVDLGTLREVSRLVFSVVTFLLTASFATAGLGFAIRLLLSPLTLVIRAGAALVGIFKGLGVVAAVIGPVLLAPFKLLLTGVGALLKLVSLVPGAFFTWVGALGLIFLAFNKIFEQILGFPISLKDTAQIISLAFGEAFGTIVAQGKISFKELANAVVQIFTDPIGFLANAFTKLLGALAGATAVAANLGIISEESRIGFEDAIASLEQLSNQRGRGESAFGLFPKEQLDKDRANLAAFLADSKLQFEALVADLAEKHDNDEFSILPPEEETQSAADKIRAIFEDLKGTVEGLLGGDGVLADTGDEVLDELNRVIAGIEDVVVTGQQEKGPFQKMFEGLADTLQAELDIARSLVQNFSSFVASSIVDAFDPTNDTTIQERFARFLQDIAKMILAQLTQIAIAKIVLGVGFGSAGVSEGGQIPGFAEGGPVPQPAHLGIKAPRPRGLDPRDTVPAWLQPEEYVIPVAAVRKYGVEFFEALRRRVIDPAALRGIGGVGHYRVRKARIFSPGFAAGGLVGGGVPNAALKASSERELVVLPVQVANEKALDQQMAQGPKSFLANVRKHAASMKAILNGAG